MALVVFPEVSSRALDAIEPDSSALKATSPDGAIELDSMVE
jgi:hypothetical protein